MNEERALVLTFQVGALSEADSVSQEDRDDENPDNRFQLQRHPFSK